MPSTSGIRQVSEDQWEHSFACRLNGLLSAGCDFHLVSFGLETLNDKFKRKRFVVGD